MSTQNTQQGNTSNSTGTQNHNNRKMNQRTGKKTYYGRAEVVIGSEKRWIKIWLRLWSIILERIYNLDVLIKEADFLSIDWADLKIVSKDKERSKWEVCSRSDGQVLARGAFNSCLLFVGGCRKQLARKHRDHLEDLIQDFLLEAVQLSKSQEKSDLDRAYLFTIKAREIATWIGGGYCKEVIEGVEDIRNDIDNRKEEINSAISSEQSAAEESSHATAEQPVDAELVEAA